MFPIAALYRKCTAARNITAYQQRPVLLANSTSHPNQMGSGGDNRETVAQAMYGKSEDDLEREEVAEMKRLFRGEPGTEEEAAAEHDAAVRAEGNTDYAPCLHDTTRKSAAQGTGVLPTDQIAATGRMDAEDVRREYPSTEGSAQGVTAPAVSDKKT